MSWRRRVVRKREDGGVEGLQRAERSGMERGREWKQQRGAWREARARAGEAASRGEV